MWNNISNNHNIDNIQMELNIYILVFVFVLIVAAIFIADNLTTAVLLISLSTSFIIMLHHLSNISIRDIFTSRDQPRESVISGHDVDLTKTQGGSAHWGTPNPDSATVQKEEIKRPPYEIYGKAYEKYNINKLTYETGYPTSVVPVDGASDAVNGVDATNVVMAQKRMREKRAMDGAIVRTANFYKYHFADELEEHERKRWWGNNEI